MNMMKMAHVKKHRRVISGSRN